jgi:uncharacterized membrane protein YeaQ/YmgE (transglycosylase-associated protein family)
MNVYKVYKGTGICGLGMVLFSWSQFPLYTVDAGPASLYDGAASAKQLFSIRNIAFTRILLDLCLYVCAMIFGAGFRQLIKHTNADYEWIGTLLFGTLIVWLAVTLVADGLQGGAVLDTLNGNADPSVVRGLTAATLLIYNGSTAFVVTAFFLAVAGYVTFTTGVLPKWTGWIAYISTGLCIVCVPAMYFGPVDYYGFYNAGGWGVAIVANFPPLIWFLVAGIMMIKKSKSGVSKKITDKYVTAA